MKSRLTKILEEYAKILWYKQGAAGRPFYFEFPAKSVTGFTRRGKTIRWNYFQFVGFIQNDFVEIYFSRRRLHAMGAWYYAHELRNPGATAATKRYWETHHLEALTRIMRYVEHTDLSGYSTAKLLQLFETFSRIYIDFWRESIFLDAFDVTSDELLEHALSQEKGVFSEHHTQILIASAEFSWVQKEKRDLLKLLNEKRVDVLKKKLQAHAARYHWILNDYAVIQRLDWKFFRTTLRALRSDPDRARKERQLLHDVEIADIARQRLMRERRMSRRSRVLVDFLCTLTKWRDDRKAYNQMANGVLRLFVEEWERRTGWKADDIEWLFYEEIVRLPHFTTRHLHRVRKRRQGIGIIGDPAKTQNVFVDKEAEKIGRFMRNVIGTQGDLRGRCAFSGKVVGTARIIFSQKDFHKMKKGDILIAPNTRPEYMPIMKLAAAIVTEEGGLTCHAAIVSRELRIPAIVGVQGAIAALHDGDRIEVDTDAGLVKKLIAKK